MEVEPNPQLIGKKLWNKIRTIFYLLKKGYSRNKLMLDLHMILKRGKLAGESITQIIHHIHQDYSSVSCNSTHVRMSIIPLREYEFSCSNSPAYPSYFSKFKNNHHHRHSHGRSSYYGAAEDMSVAWKALDGLYNKYEGVVVDASSPLMSLPGFGHSPMVRGLRVTDSPFSVKDSEETNPQVDMDCEEFINLIRNGWKRQEMVAAIESPTSYHLRAQAFY